MLVIPAIDLQNGRCVRLLRGDFAQETVYGDDPPAIARRWRDAGAELVHVVDLDGTRQGQPVQAEIMRRIAAEAPVQAAGGLRTRDDVEQAAAWAQRVVVGSSAAFQPDLVADLVPMLGDRLVVALDTRGDTVTVYGWTENTDLTLLELARTLIDAGARRFLHTDVARDGAMTSPNYASLERLVTLGVPVIASGGVASLDDIRRLKECGAEAVIVGRALYEGAIDLQEAIRVAG